MLSFTRKDKIRNEVIRAKTKVKDIESRAENAKGQWAGHVARMNTRKWARITTEWTPRNGKRTKGRPKRRWRDDIELKVGTAWTQLAQNRRAWKNLWRPPASSGVKG